MSEPGIKVMHIAHLDYMTHYLTFGQALETLYRIIFRSMYCWN